MSLRSLGYGKKGDTGAQGNTGSQGAKGDTGATGAAGSNATATPLGTATPQPLGTAIAGTSANASHEDHVHAKQVQLIGSINVTETLLLSLSVGMKRKDFALAGVTPADANKLLLVPNGTPTAGCEAVNAYPSATSGQVSIGYYTPVLGIGATYSIPVSVFRIT